MSRVLAIDYGQKRVGIAITDEEQIIASALTTLNSKDVIPFLKDYLDKEVVECFVVGLAKNLDDTPSESARFIEPFVRRLKDAFPEVSIERVDERFTSKMAFQTMIDAGVKQRKRRDKGLVDKISATLILQSFLDARK
ncbi:MAG: Holliday junction resolvase RuvX [Flavobacteriales bacterium]|jgi:putative Holliday junction resolvase|nr:Holliday junction resolvase RuvX [Flavobacteriales bacterium]|tara:strand:- start:1589 stop:2002 length:414 start_codon:yes stop_codon:yes gene_type:complete